MNYSPWGHKELDTTEHACSSSILQVTDSFLGYAKEMMMSLQKAFSVSVTVLSISRVYLVFYNVYLSAKISYLIMHAVCFISTRVILNFMFDSSNTHVLRIWFY